MATINKHKEGLGSQNLVNDLGLHATGTTVKRPARDQRELAESESTPDTGFNTATFSWIYNKLLTCYVGIVIGLMLLKYFEVISLNVFLVGLFSGFGISLAMMGYGFSKLVQYAKQTDPNRQSDNHLSS